MSEMECPNTQREDGDHCDHSWSHEHCCWCGARWGEGGMVERPATYDGTFPMITRSGTSAVGGGS